ncbi:MAG: hypothetical protein QW190_05155 [Thermoproteota archaeon]
MTVWLKNLYESNILSCWWPTSMKNVHYRPVDGFFGDAIPFYWRGSYHVFYLKTTRKTGDRLIWSHIVSNDLVHWREMPDAILPGEKDAPDSGGCWTGCVLEKDVFSTRFTPGGIQATVFLRRFAMLSAVTL